MEYVIGAVLFLALYGVLVWRKARQQTARLRKLIRKHLKTLVLKRARGFTRDDYGNLVDSGWSKEMAYFYDNVIPANLRSDRALSDVAAMIEQEIRRLPAETFDAWTLAEARDIATGDDFEGFVSEKLERRGWLVRHTGRSGDQGADMVARKGAVSVAVQCKLYSQPVGNKAVQEVLAAQSYYATDLAAVISNAAFTRSAARLAQSANVLLLHATDLDALDGLADGEAAMHPTADRARGR